MQDITREEMLELVSFKKVGGKWVVEDVKGDVYGNVCGDVWRNVGGKVLGKVWGKVKTGRTHLPTSSCKHAKSATNNDQAGGKSMRIDHEYAREKLVLLLRDLDRYNGDEFWRQMSRIANGATDHPSTEDILKERIELAAHVETLRSRLKDISAPVAMLQREAKEAGPPKR